MEQGQIDPNDVEVQFGSLNTYLMRVRAMAREAGSGRPVRGLSLSERLGRTSSGAVPPNEGSRPTQFDAPAPGAGAEALPSMPGQGLVSGSKTADGVGTVTTSN